MHANCSPSCALDSLITADCEPYKSVVLGFIEDSFCDSAYSGLFVMVRNSFIHSFTHSLLLTHSFQWICQFICSGCLYCTMCCASVLYHYFDDKYWTLTADGYSQASGDDTQMDNVYASTNAPKGESAPVYDAKKAVELTTTSNIKRL